MLAVYIFLAVFASFRLTEALLVDEIFYPLHWIGNKRTIALRRRLNLPIDNPEGPRQWFDRFMNCQRCMSFWGAILPLEVLALTGALPISWPVLFLGALAISYSFLYFGRVNDHLMPRKREGVFLEFVPQGVRVDWGNFDPKIGVKAMRDLLAQIDETEKKMAEQRAAILKEKHG